MACFSVFTGLVSPSFASSPEGETCSAVPGGSGASIGGASTDGASIDAASTDGASTELLASPGTLASPGPASPPTSAGRGKPQAETSANTSEMRDEPPMVQYQPMSTRP